jgi:hypothetical protein
MFRANLGNGYFWEHQQTEEQNNGRALTKWRRNGARAQAQEKPLQKTLRPEPCDGVYYSLPLENPAGHRKAQRRIEQMHFFHRHPQIPDRLL